MVNILALASGERVQAILPVAEFAEGWFVLLATLRGIIKKTDLMAFANPRAGGIIGINLDEGDEVVAARLTDGKKNIFLSTLKGQSIHFKEEEARPMGRATRGVKGIDLRPDDEVVSMEVTEPGERMATMLTVTEGGFGKRTQLGEYRLQTRGGKGIITIKTSQRNGAVVGVTQVLENDEMVLISDAGKVIRLVARDNLDHRPEHPGVKLIGLAEGERLVALARVADEA